MKLNIKKLDGSNLQIKCDSFSIVTYGKDKTIKELYSGSEIEKVSVISNDINENMSLHDCKLKYLSLLSILDKSDEVHPWMIVDLNNSSVIHLRQRIKEIEEYIIKALCQI